MANEFSNANVSAVCGVLITPAPVMGLGLAEFGVLSNKRFGMVILLSYFCFDHLFL
ncbi:MAG TPA: hypothetical protein VN843_23265 [Anaerolineales bacterium]|nr:hypothetical protein [Anaerolineales bacterium]